MSTNSPFRTHVGDLLRLPGNARRVHLEEIVDWSVGQIRLSPDVPLVADLDLASTSGGLVVRGRASATVVSSCVRCLDDITEDVSVEVAQLVEDETDEDAAEDAEAYLLDGDVVDLEPILRDDVLLALPLVPRCPDGCAGPVAELVTGPETGLNTDTPGAGGAESPFAALEGMFDTGD